MKQNKVLMWCRSHGNLIRAFVAMWLPLLCCMMTCALEGKSIADVYLPASDDAITSRPLYVPQFLQAL